MIKYIDIKHCRGKISVNHSWLNPNTKAASFLQTNRAKHFHLDSMLFLLHVLCYFSNLERQLLL